jgi:hypothetical protein
MKPTDIAKMVVALFTTLFFVAIATAFVLPGRPSPAVIKAFFSALSGSIAATIGATPGGIGTTAGSATAPTGTGNVSPLTRVTSNITKVIPSTPPNTQPILTQHGGPQ